MKLCISCFRNRGLCKRYGNSNEAKDECKLPKNTPFFALEDFEFEIYDPSECPLCKEGLPAVKPGSRAK